MNKTLLIVSVVLAFTLSSCGDGWKTTDRGLNYQIVTDNDTAKAIEIGNLVEYQVTFRNEKDSIIFNSKEREKKGTVIMVVDKPTYEGCIMEGFTMLSEGDSARFKINIDSFFIKTLQSKSVNPSLKTKPNEIVTVDMKVMKVHASEKEFDQFKIREEKAKIEKFMASGDMKDAKMTDDGLYYKVSGTAEGEIAKSGDEITMVCKITNFKDSVVNELTRENPLVLVKDEEPTWAGMLTALDMMRKGEKWKFIFPSPMAFGPRGIRGVEPYEPLIFEMEILSIKDSATQAKEKLALKNGEKAKINNYLKQNKGFKEQSGIYYRIEKSTNDVQAKMGDLLTLDYKGTWVDGRIFDESYSSNPMQVVLGQGRVIPGWELGLALMKKGEKYTFLIPSELAYGSQRYMKFDPYTPLVFEVELHEIQSAPKMRR